MLKEHDVEFEYREYRNDPLSVEEIRSVLDMLGVEARDVLRKADRAAKDLGLTGHESNDRLVELMAEHPTLLQRPIGIKRGRAAIGRPPENLLELVS